MGGMTSPTVVSSEIPKEEVRRWMADADVQTTTAFISCTALLCAEERGVQRCSLAPFLIFSIPADLRSYLRSNQLASMQYKAQGLHTFRIRLSKPFLSLNS